MSLVKWTLHELQERLTCGDVNATDIARAYFLRIGAVEPRVNAYITLNEQETVLSEARALDDSMKSWRKTMPMMAMPIAIKDNICTKGVLTTGGSRILAGFTPPYNATVVDALRAHRCFVMGKTNLDEFGMGSSTEYSAFGPSRNPWKLACVPGGSSGGSAAAVAADECVAALGTDTGRVHPSAGRLLRSGRPEAHLRTGVALRTPGLCLIAGFKSAPLPKTSGMPL